MTISVDDITEQICVASVLLESKTISGKRLAMVVIDNAVEFMLKCYGSTELIGKTIPKTQWDEKKGSFKWVLDFVFGKANLSPNPQDILEYHNTRNALYHEALPLSVEPVQARNYISESKILLKELFKKDLTEAEWKHRVAQARIGLTTTKQAALIEYEKVDEAHIKVLSESSLTKEVDSILLVVYGYAKILGLKPTLEELEGSLSFSGHPISPRSRLQNHLGQLRRRNLLNKRELSLTRKGIEILNNKFFIPQE